jgi:transposase
VEAFERSGRTRVDFAALWGVSPSTLTKWIRRYEREGPRGLETRKHGGPGRPRSISGEVRAEIVRTKRRFPTFGMRKVRDWLARFAGVRVSAGTVQTTLREHGLADGAERPKAKRKAHPPRRFERVRPMQLWQSDITSFLLTRHHRRVYWTNRSHKRRQR